MVPLQSEHQTHFAFTWKGQQYTFTRLSQGLKRSPILARELEKIPLDKEVKIYQYIDDVLMGGVSEQHQFTKSRPQSLNT